MNMEKNGKKISWTEHNKKLRSPGNNWRRKSPDTDTKKETMEMEPKKKQWNGPGLLFLQVFLLYFTLRIIFLFYILPLMQKIKNLVAGAPDGRKKETEGIEWT